MSRRLAFAGPCFDGFPFFCKDTLRNNRLSMTRDQLLSLFWRVKTFTVSASTLQGNLTIPKTYLLPPNNSVDLVMPFAFDFGLTSLTSTSSDEAEILNGTARPLGAFIRLRYWATSTVDNTVSDSSYCPSNGGFTLALIPWQPPMDSLGNATGGIIARTGAGQSGATYAPEGWIGAGFSFQIGILAGPFNTGAVDIGVGVGLDADLVPATGEQEIGTFTLNLGAATWTAPIVASGVMPEIPQDINMDGILVTPNPDPLPSQWPLTFSPFNVTLTASAWWPYKGKDGGAI